MLAPCENAEKRVNPNLGFRNAFLNHISRLCLHDTGMNYIVGSRLNRSSHSEMKAG